MIGPSGLVARHDFTLNECGVEASVVMVSFGLIYRAEQTYYLHGDVTEIVLRYSTAAEIELLYFDIV